ncbi:MAG: SRPBCC family protein [Gemmatimonadales bacterium]
MKYALTAAAILAGIVLLVLVVGWSLPVKHHAAREEVFAATPHTIFELITDVDSFPQWRSSVKTVEHVPDTLGKRRFRETGSDGPILYEIEESVPDSRLVTRIAETNLAFGGSWTYELTPRGDSTALRITENGEVYNPIFRFVSRFIMGHTSTIDDYLAALRKRTENP